ncbi:MAG: 50S ribosomal protein L19 [Candidatus Pacebacteria bacterium]|nr:50S ribosomal protein L19 [Candidatus Paceibacterota bacterium]
MAKTANIKISTVNLTARKELDMRSGDTVRVWIKVEEKGKTRLQAFEGTVLARKGGTQAGATFTVRRVSGGYGVEKIFPLYSPLVDKIEVLRRVKTRRSKLYHIRDKAAREIRRQMRKMHTVAFTTDVPEAEIPEAIEPEEVAPEVIETPSEEIKEETAA